MLELEFKNIVKVGILTFHEVFNPGAFLQALATQRLVESMGHEAKIIDYTPVTHRHSLVRDLRGLSWRLPFRFQRALANRKKDASFRKARNRWMNMTQRFETAADVGKEQFDAVLIGADVVWNFQIERYGRDPLYFGTGLNTRKRISFAPSFGPCEVSDHPPDYVREGLRKFDHISVRDQNSKEIVRSLTQLEPPIICDPAFHLDLTKLPRDCPEKKPFLLVYMVAPYVTTETISEIRGFAKSKGLSVVATLYHQKWADKNRTTGGPMEWLGLLHHADYVVTNTFHGMVFCCKMQKKFALQYTPSIRNKSLHTVERLGLNPLIADKDRSIEQVLTSGFSFDGIEKQITEMTGQAKHFLVESLEN